MASSRMGCLLGCVLIVAALLQGATAQTTHVVGGSSVGWTIPSAGFSYDTWSSSQTFSVGDILVFDFQTGAHNVAQVSKTDYDSCTSTNTIGTLVTTGPANVTIDSAGDHYYICTVGQHCASGQKLAISTGSSTSSTPSPTSSVTPTPTTTDGTPASSASSLTVGVFCLLLLSTSIALFY